MLLRQRPQVLRQELTDLEQFVLIQIFDQSWKDHLYAMDMLKSGIGLQAFAEKDPRIVVQEGRVPLLRGDDDRHPRQGHRPDLPRPPRPRQPQARSAYRETAAVHEDAGGYGVAENLAATAGVAKGATVEENEAAGVRRGRGRRRRSRRSSTRRPKVGRNDPCPCGSGKKYKKCHGA